jgi:hypothetical protein
MGREGLEETNKSSMNTMNLATKSSNKKRNSLVDTSERSLIAASTFFPAVLTVQKL